MSESNFQKDNKNKLNSNFPHPLETKQPKNEEIKEEQIQTL